MFIFFHGDRSSSSVPRVKLPKELFVDIAVTVGNEVNRVLEYVQDIACSGNLKQLLVVPFELLDFFARIYEETRFLC